MSGGGGWSSGYIDRLGQTFASTLQGTGGYSVLGAQQTMLKRAREDGELSFAVPGTDYYMPGEANPIPVRDGGTGKQSFPVGTLISAGSNADLTHPFVSVAIPSDGSTYGVVNAAGVLSASAIPGVSGILSVAFGGTSFGLYAIGDMTYASGTTSFSRIPIGSVGQALTVASDGVSIDWEYAASGSTSVSSSGGANQVLVVPVTGMTGNSKVFISPMPTQIVDYNCMYVSSVSAGQFTIQVIGLAPLVSYGVKWFIPNPL